MRILVLAPFVLDQESLDNRAGQAHMLGESLGIDFEFRGVKHGPREYDTHVDWLVADAAIVHAGCNAQQEGFDAICIDTLSDAGVNAMRSVVDVPVVGAGQAAYLLALATAPRFSILTQWRPWFVIYEKGLQDYGLRDKCVSMRSIEVRPDLQNLLGGKEDEVFPMLLKEAHGCVEDGAGAIVLGSTTMHQAHPFLAANLPVPVINPGPASYKLAQTLSQLRLGHSRSTWQRADSTALDGLSWFFRA